MIYGDMRYIEWIKIASLQKRECIYCQRGDGKGGYWGTAKDFTEGWRGQET